MRLILTGCEYTGKTTVAKEIASWIEKTMGPPIPQGMPPFHDHFTFPNIKHEELTDEECKQVWALSPRIKEQIQNHQVEYHQNEAFYRDHDNILVGFHIEEAVYAPIYYGYGVNGARSAWARSVDSQIMHKAPDTVLVLLKSSHQVIANRMKQNPHPKGILKEKDIDLVLKRFEEEYGNSLIRYRFSLDTSNSTASETLKQFVEFITPHLREDDRSRILIRRAMQQNG